MVTLFISQLDHGTQPHDIVWAMSNANCGLVKDITFVKNSTKPLPCAVVRFRSWTSGPQNSVHHRLVTLGKSSPLQEYRLWFTQTDYWLVSIYHPLKAVVHSVPAVCEEIAPFQVKLYVPHPAGGDGARTYEVTWAADTMATLWQRTAGKKGEKEQAEKEEAEQEDGEQEDGEEGEEDTFSCSDCSNFSDGSSLGFDLASFSPCPKTAAEIESELSQKIAECQVLHQQLLAAFG